MKLFESHHLQSLINLMLEELREQTWPSRKLSAIADCINLLSFKRTYFVRVTRITNLILAKFTARLSEMFVPYIRQFSDMCYTIAERGLHEHVGGYYMDRFYEKSLKVLGVILEVFTTIFMNCGHSFVEPGKPYLDSELLYLLIPHDCRYNQL